jgi:hypothetical protein
MANCAGCGNQHAYHVKTWFSKEGKQEICNACGLSGGTGLADVYFRGPHHDANIVDGMGNEILIRSKQHKKALLKERGWVEEGLHRHNRYT